MVRDRPYVILNAAMSLDGKIATRMGRARISSPEDMQRMQELRTSVDGIMIGINTLLIDDPSLRLKLEKRGDPPARIIVDSRLRTPVDARIFSYPGRVIIGISSIAPTERISQMEGRAEIVKTSGRIVELRELLWELRKRGIERLLLEGGGNLNWGMITAGLVDEVRIAVAPLIIGGRETVTLVEGEGVGDIDNAPGLRLVDVRRYGRDVVLTYRTEVSR
jgi:2,5-diamino-6-(ribosylamino)-4(3H)-pyrimidinone 5'-phosphate reductase